MTFSEFLLRLHTIDRGANGFNIIDSANPHFIFYGRNSANAPALWISLPTSVTRTDGIEEPKPTKCIDTSVGIDEKHINVTFSLKELSFEELFDSICFDLFTLLSKVAPEDSYEELAKRYDSWRRLFEKQGKHSLSDAEIKGLLGELLAMNHFLQHGHPEAVEAWGGPAKADRDFEFPDTWAEVKGVKLDATTVSISSLEQLDTTTSGVLHLFRIEKGPANRTDAFSLADIVSKCKASIVRPQDVVLFDAKLQLAGYDASDEKLTEKVFTLHEHSVYAVEDSFPRIRRAFVPVEVARASYELFIPMLTKFKTATLFPIAPQS